MSSKPSYLGLLNAIAVGEGRGYQLLSSWSQACANPALTAVLDVVAIREQEHCAAFTKRVCELGFTIRETPNPKFDEHLRLAGSGASDREKFETILGYDRDDNSDDPLARLFDDPTIDAQTGALLGRFIAEERDSGRILREQYAGLDSKAAEIAEITERLDRLTETLNELKRLNPA